MFDCTEIGALVGRTFSKIENTGDTITFYGDDGRKVLMHHDQDCCEDVTVEDISGNLDDLIGTPILIAEERSEDDPDACEYGCWTFYVLRTVKGSVTIRWYGSSNGYYGCDVSIKEVVETN